MPNGIIIKNFNYNIKNTVTQIMAMITNGKPSGKYLEKKVFRKDILD
jgi:hypothetical protein